MGGGTGLATYSESLWVTKKEFNALKLTVIETYLIDAEKRFCWTRHRSDLRRLRALMRDYYEITAIPWERSSCSELVQDVAGQRTFETFADADDEALAEDAPHDSGRPSP